MLSDGTTVDGALSSADVMALEAEREDGASSFMVAHYEDEYLQVDGQWFFANRSLVPHHRRVSETRAEEAEAPASGSSGPGAPVPPVGQNGD